MAQQASNAQREPSMDEILASIRRIIEESEPDRPSVDLSAIEQLSSPAIGPAANDVARTATAPALHSISVLESLSVADEPSHALSDTFDSNVFELDPELDAAFREMDGMRAELAQQQVETPDVEMEIGPSFQPPIFVSPDSADAAPEADRSKPIVSEGAVRRVAASFGDLADAFAASRQRSFDEMAEEMLRPMLRDWLDNNLPTMVERLVREEIERIARG